MARKEEEKVREKGRKRKRKKETPIQDGREDTAEVGEGAK